MSFRFRGINSNEVLSKANSVIFNAYKILGKIEKESSAIS